MVVLVTGGAGYIGSHTCVSFLNAGCEVVVVDNFSNSRSEALTRVAELTGTAIASYDVDLRNRDQLNEVFAANHIDAVVHFAGLKAVGESIALPLRYYSNNVAATLTLLDVMQQHGVKQMVFSSSATVYGMQERVPLTEDMPLSAANPYGRTKSVIEMMLRDLSTADPGWSIALLRYFNPVGAHESGRIGEDPNGVPNNLVPYITQVAVGKRAELTVHGDDYPTPDGTCIRDYIHVMDLAEGHVQALDYVSKTTGIEAFNLGTGVGHSVFEMVAAFERVTGAVVPKRVGQRRPGDAPISYADPSKANRVLGWRTTRSLEAMLVDAWCWQSQNPDGYTLR